MKRARSQPPGDSRRRPSAGAAPPPIASADAASPPPDHIPVLLDAVLAALAPSDGAVYVDGTFGAGGYSAALLGAARCRVVGIDRDPDAVRQGAALAARHPGRLTLIEGRFGDMERLVGAASPGPIAGVALDLGVSSMQLDSAERGFSFRLDGPLDMRMGGEGMDAADLVARLSEDALAELIRSLGEERFARRVARAIVAARQQGPIRRTGELARIVRGAIPTREPGLDPATRTFQALRIAVNREIEVLENILPQVVETLAPQGKVAIISFHSLEDRRVKNFFRETENLHVLTKHPVRPTREEEQINPRSRSAKLRVAEKVV
jgi:16S rRNA (cytosine1402-N4)-methyltransferase